MPALVSSSAQSVARSRIRELAEIALTMDGVHKLFFGESNLPTPAFLKDAAARAMADGFTTYCPNAGLLSTRQALADYYQLHHAVTLDPTQQVCRSLASCGTVDMATAPPVADTPRTAAAAVMESGDTTPGGATLGASRYLDRLLSAFDSDAPLFYADAEGRSPIVLDARGCSPRRVGGASTTSSS